jgi:pimeloyl-ACP methyl ester carboxylesterase
MIDGTSTSRENPSGDRRLDRRAVLGGAAGAAAAGLVTRLGAPTPAVAQNGTPTSAEGEQATFVLVAGSFAGGWIWGKVVPPLREEGHDVYSTTLTGLGDRVHLADPAIDLDTGVTDVVNVLEFEDLHDVTLVAHSSGGMVITGVAERVPERLARLVYLDAWVPADGQSDYDVGIASDEARAEAIAFEIAAGWAAGTPGFRPIDADVEGFITGMIEDPADAEWMVSKLVPHPLAAWTQPIQLGNPAAAELPHAFIFCTEEKGTADEDPTVRIAEWVRSDPDWTYRELAGNHLALVNDPQATAEALLSLV